MTPKWNPPTVQPPPPGLELMQENEHDDDDNHESMSNSLDQIPQQEQEDCSLGQAAIELLARHLPKPGLNQSRA
jgi:hypothetical protein